MRESSAYAAEGSHTGTNVMTDQQLLEHRKVRSNPGKQACSGMSTALHTVRVRHSSESTTRVLQDFILEFIEVSVKLNAASATLASYSTA